MIGQTISHYRITEKLGEGGMGVVYKAEDTKLKRTVALKFLSSQALGDKDQKARFLREAQAAAILDHPNIATVHDIGEEDGHTFIAMAFVDGPDLSEKIKERPLKLDEAIDITIQICEGLKEAHEQGVTHRDIKPSNIMVTRKGRVKITDFGLAHLAGRSKLTKSGTSLGTPQYMSPEQALSEETDRRSDIWGVGVVLYEMIAGRAPFDSDYEQATVYSIVNETYEPLTAVRTGLPTELDRVVGKALAKRPEERYQHIDEFLVDLRGIRRRTAKSKSLAVTSSDQRPAGPLGRYRVKEQRQRTGPGVFYQAGDTVSREDVEIQILPQKAALAVRKRQRVERLTALGLGLMSVILLAAWAFYPTEGSEAPLRKFTIEIPESLKGKPKPRNLPTGIGAAVSPNGVMVAFTDIWGDGPIWLRDLREQEAHPIEGTEGTASMFWSPDSRSLGFFQGQELKTMRLNGGPATRLCAWEGRTVGNGTWSPDGDRIAYFTCDPNGCRIYEVSASGGPPKVLLEPEGEQRFVTGPHFLPAGTTSPVLLFGTGPDPQMQVGVLELSPNRSTLLFEGINPVYSPTGHLLYERRTREESVLWAVPFALDTLSPDGDPFPVGQNAHFANVSSDGTLVYTEEIPFTAQQLVWRDRAGELVESVGQPQETISYPSLSPDGNSVVVQGNEQGARSVWRHDLRRSIKTRLTFESGGQSWTGWPIWGPDEKLITFFRMRQGEEIVNKVPDPGAAETVLSHLGEGEGYQYATDWSWDGLRLVFLRVLPPLGETDAADLWYFERQADGSFEEKTFTDTPFDEGGGQLSPDGKYIVYSADSSGENQIYVQPFPEGGKTDQISRDGGTQARWSDDGREIFFVNDENLYSVAVRQGPTLSFGAPKELFSNPHLGPGGEMPGYDVSRDGQKFLLVEPAGASKTTIRVVQNWYEEFRDREQD